MAAAASVAWFLEAAAAGCSRSPSDEVPFDILVLICMAAWQRDAKAPRPRGHQSHLQERERGSRNQPQVHRRDAKARAHITLSQSLPWPVACG